ncbi:Breast cancer 2, early onset [Entophlyctis luteolus]|nr:Breast cancer 2, early onset [Entophlyctis luteolus]
MNEASNADAGPGTRGSALQSPKSTPNSSSDTRAEVEVREILPISIESATTAESELPVPMTSENSIFSDGSFTGAQMRWAEEAENEASFSKSGIASASKNLAQSDHQAGASGAPSIVPKTSPFQHRTPLREIIARTHRVRTPEIPSSNSIGSIRAEKQRRRLALHSSRANADHEKLNTKDHWEKTPPLKQSDSRKRLRNLFASHGGRKIEDLLKKSKNETVTDSSTLSKTEKLIAAESTANSITDQELLAFIDEGQLEISNDELWAQAASSQKPRLGDRMVEERSVFFLAPAISCFPETPKIEPVVANFGAFEPRNLNGRNSDKPEVKTRKISQNEEILETPQFGGFTNGRGNFLAIPTAEQTAAAAKFLLVSTVTEQSDDDSTRRMSFPSACFFTGAGKRLASPTKEQRDAVRKMFGNSTDSVTELSQPTENLPVRETKSNRSNILPASGRKLPSPTAKRKELADRGSTESYLVPSADEYHERKTTVDIECANGGKKALEVGFRMADDQLNLAADMFLSLANGRVTGAGQCLESDSKVPASGFKTGRGKNLGELTPRQEAFAKALFTECDEVRPQIDAANGDKAQENNPSVKTPELVTATSTATATLSEPMGKSKYHLVTTKASSKPFITPFKSPLTLSGTANSNVTPSGKPWRTSHVVSLIKTTRAGIIPSDAPPMNTPIRQFGQKPFKIPSSTNKSSTTTPGTVSRCEKPSSAAASKIVFFDIHGKFWDSTLATSTASLVGKFPRITLRERFRESRHTCTYSELLEISIWPEVLNMNSVSAQSFKFPAHDSDRGTWGWRDAAFDLHVRGAKVSVASEAWTSNHYRWIVWKFASKARAFPELWKENFFCRENVFNELLYRYQIEYCEGKRSCLKKVFEGDQIAEALMILCVADILVDGVSVSESGIDANGFSVKSQLDFVLRRAVENEKIVIGQKLMIFGAQAIGSVGSYSPLEAGSKILLGIHGNSTRIATWDAKLGNQRTSFPFQVSIASAKPDGGPLPLVDCIIERVFPLSYVEGQQKRSQLEEDEQMRKYEKLFQDECDKVVSDLTKSGDIDETTDIRQIVVERIGKREVSTMLKIRISDYLPDGCDLEDTCSRTVTIWNPDPHMLEMLQEGLRVKFVGLLPDAWGKGGGTCNFKLGPKRQLFPVATTPAMIAAKSTYVARRFVAIREIEGFITNQEFDAIGVVLSSTESRATLTDESLMLLNVQCYNGELRVVKTGDIISLKNLVYQHGSGSQFYSHFRKGFGVIGAALSASEKERRVELNSFCKSQRFFDLRSQFLDS